MEERNRKTIYCRSCSLSISSSHVWIRKHPFFISCLLKSYYNKFSAIKPGIVCTEKWWRPNIISCLKPDWSSNWLVDQLTRLIRILSTWKSIFLFGLYSLKIVSYRWSSVKFLQRKSWMKTLFIKRVDKW